MADTIVWISGASSGIGAGLARHVPYPDARVVNLDIVAHAGLETVPFDLTRPDTWDAVAEHFADEMRHFDGKRVLFIHNAIAMIGVGRVGRIDPVAYRESMVANFVAPIALAEAFLRAVPPRLEAGLVLMSSGAAAHPLIGQTAYGAAKAGIEQWVRIARAEMTERANLWIVAVRPGLVPTETVLRLTEYDPELYPRVHALRQALTTVGVDADTAAKRIWASLPPRPTQALISFEGVALPGNAAFA